MRRRLAAVAAAFERYGVPMHRDQLSAILRDSEPDLFGSSGELAAFLRDHENTFPNLGDGVHWSRHADLAHAAREGASADQLSELGDISWSGLRDADRAQQAYSEALCRDITHMRARQGLVDVYMAKGRYADAARVLHWLRWRLPKSRRTLLLSATCAEKLDHWDEGMEYWEELVESSPDDLGFLLHLARSALNAEELDVATATLDRILDVDPDIAEAQILLARLGHEQGDIELATRAMGRALELDVGLVARSCPAALIDAFLRVSDDRDHWSTELSNYMRMY